MIKLTDVTLREHGQNLRAKALATFTPTFRASVAQQLIAAGVRRMELFSCVSPRVAPVMALDEIRHTLAELGRPDGVEVVTLVPNRRGFENFLDLGLGPERYGHTIGFFFSVVDAHNRANLGRSRAESLAEYRELADEAIRREIPIALYLSTAFGFRHPGGEMEIPSPEQVAALVAEWLALGARSITLADTQGVATEARIGAVVGAAVAVTASHPHGELGYHPHHHDPARGVGLAGAAYDAGIRCFDGSLGGTGGCVTGAPGNVPSELLLAYFAARDIRTGVDHTAIHASAEAFHGPLRPH